MLIYQLVKAEFYLQRKDTKYKLAFNKEETEIGVKDMNDKREWSRIKEKKTSGMCIQMKMTVPEIKDWMKKLNSVFSTKGKIAELNLEYENMKSNDHKKKTWN